MLFEDAYEQAVSASALSVGEFVLVTTKMGSEVANGTVTRVYGNGAVQIHTDDYPETTPAGGFQSNGDPIYNADLYLFIPLDELPGAAVEDKSISEADPEPKAADKAKEKEEPEEEEPKSAAQKADKKTDVKLKNSGIRKDARDAKAKVDVDKLPEDLKQKVQGIDKLDEAQIDRVMSAISEAALKPLKDVGVADSEVYERVVAIQKAVRTKFSKQSGG